MFACTLTSKHKIKAPNDYILSLTTLPGPSKRISITDTSVDGSVDVIHVTVYKNMETSLPNISIHRNTWNIWRRRGSAVDIVTTLRAECPGIVVRPRTGQEIFLRQAFTFKACSGTQRVSYSKGTMGTFPRDRANGAWISPTTSSK
jgi:hypothetical protein